LDRENPEERAGRGIPQEPVNHDRARASQALLARIRELYMAGRSAEEIASQVLTTEPENAMFRAAMLVEIILHYCPCGTEEKNQ